VPVRVRPRADPLPPSIIVFRLEVLQIGGDQLFIVRVAGDVPHAHSVFAWPPRCLADLQGDCTKAKQLFDQAEKEGACVCAADRQLCEPPQR
jgi:hypothetical protein